MMKEEWKPVVGFEPFYEVSNTGRVRSIAVWSDKYQRIIKRPVSKEKRIETTKDGYKRVLLCYYGKHHHICGDMITRACRGQAKTAGGYRWSYAK